MISVQESIVSSERMLTMLAEYLSKLSPEFLQTYAWQKTQYFQLVTAETPPYHYIAVKIETEV